jgi:hypothetical protein
MAKPKKKTKIILISILIILALSFIAYFGVTNAITGIGERLDYTIISGNWNQKYIAEGNTGTYVLEAKLKENLTDGINAIYFTSDWDIETIYDSSTDGRFNLKTEIYNYETSSWEKIDENSFSLKNYKSMRSELGTDGEQIYVTGIPELMDSIKTKDADKSSNRRYTSYLSCLDGMSVSEAKSLYCEGKTSNRCTGDSRYTIKCVYAGESISEHEVDDDSDEKWDIEYFPKLFKADSRHIRNNNIKLRGTIRINSKGLIDITQSDILDLDFWKAESQLIDTYSGTDCTLKEKYTYQVLDTDYYTLKECQIANRLVDDPEQPDSPQPSSFSRLIDSIKSWFTNLFDKIFTYQSIVGDKSIEPNTQHTYQISISTDTPDKDYSDGTYQVQYGNWALLDSEGNIEQEGNWEEIDGIYQKSVTITTPSQIGDYVLVGIIDQFDMTFDYSTGEWSYTESIVNKEAINLETEYSVTNPTNPTPSALSQFLSKIWNWFLNLFN